MKPRLLNWLICPYDRGGLRLENAVERDGEVESGSLTCHTCRKNYHIVRGVPRFVPSDGYASSFGLQWNHYAQVQLDSRNGTNYSRERFYAINEWRPPTLRDQLVLDVGCGAGRFGD